jgi:uncharacterized protein
LLHVVRFTDKKDSYAVRSAQLQAHINWLAANRDVVLVGGSLRFEPEDSPVGGLWIVEAASKAEIEALLKTDPFWLHGLRESYEILLWSKAFPEKVSV